MRSVSLVSVLLVALVLGYTPSARANSVLDWNQQALNATRLARNPPPPASYFLAVYHLAIFDAVNGITGTHQGWHVKDRAPEGADIDAAIAGAAHTALVALWSSSTNPRNLQTAYDKALATIPDGKAKDDGLAWGKHVAELILKRCSDSGFNKPIPGVYSSNEPGKWRETPSAFRPPLMPFWAKVRPFAMTSVDQFRAPPPHPVDSKEHADELAFVARVGPRDGADRDDYQTMSTPFWSDDLGTATPPGHWNVVAQDLARRNKLSNPESARLLALLNVALADAAISCWDTKFFYNTWRPETGIRELEAKVNPHAVVKPDFIPNLASPSFPSYTSGHSTFSGAAARSMALFFGTDDIEFSLTSDGLPGALRHYKKLSDAQREAGMSRVWGGIHTMMDNLEGQKAGMAIAEWVFANSLLPRK
jgi:hypothetical protein